MPGLGAVKLKKITYIRHYFQKLHIIFFSDILSFLGADFASPQQLRLSAQCAIIFRGGSGHVPGLGAVKLKNRMYGL